jgi:MazG family protein
MYKKTNHKPKKDENTEGLLAIMKKLRDPDGGCPWDLKQTFLSIAPYTIEEAYEVSDAIERGNFSDLKDELGDLLLQVVFHACIAEENDYFTYKDVVSGICKKMIRRHPHVFDSTGKKDVVAVRESWENIKRQERTEKIRGTANTGLLDDIPKALPSLTRSIKLQNRAAEVGFDWPNTSNVVEKIAEESAELIEVADTHDTHKIIEEFGDLLFAFANLARHLKVDPETALRGANDKFTRRFKKIEDGLQVLGKTLGGASLEEMEDLWNEAKYAESAH